ncbi:MAG: chemotaxis protein [Myxococcaceae bacterium]|nr:chemotaxis protein [Myxococcaceae bacterium]
MAESFDRSEFVAGYLDEVEEHLSHANAQLLKLEAATAKGAPQLRMIRELFRALHTIKGLSAMVNVEPVVELAHEMESLLRVRDQTSRPIGTQGVELMFRGVRAIELRVRAFADKKPIEPAPQELLGALHDLIADSGATVQATAAQLSLPVELAQKLSPSDLEQLVQAIEAGSLALCIDFSPSPERAAAGLTITTLRERVSKVSDIVKVVPRSVPKSAEAPSGLTFSLLVLAQAEPAAIAFAAQVDESALVPVTLTPRSRPASEAPGEEEAVDTDALDSADVLQHDTIRVEVSRLDDALEKLAALVVTRYRLERAVRDLRERGTDVRALEVIVGEHRRELARLRSSLTHARMVSMRQLLERVPLLVRGMARDSGKLVQLQIDAGRAELDKAVAERVFPALVHLVRNAVDHAIESSEERARLGKPEAGVITVRCFERAGNQLELSVSDDGCGIERERVAHKAGVPVPDDDRGLLDLITRPGLSTRDAANSRSGRGMGMDIVRRVAVGLLGGELSMITEPGRGTTFTLRLPMSISILDSFTFRCGNQSFVVPLATVEEVIELDSAQVFGAPAPRGRAQVARLLRRRGENIPLFELASFFALTPTAGLRSALVVQREGERFAFTVDHMLGQQEVVVRPLEDPLVKVPGVTGSTDLGDGRPTLVLDLWALTRSMEQRTPAEVYS